ncbi:MAG: chemotaxis response regulator protein-glutamate methylesterase [Candidatus Hydrothermarchaeales archaeon]
MDKIRALVVDDSAFMRRVISDILDSDEDIEVVGTARNGEDAIKKVESISPDVVTLDIEMPKMDGLTALSHIMSRCPTPVVMVSAMDKREADIAVRSLECGAVDFISKPSKITALGYKREELLEKVKTAAMVDVKLLKFSLPETAYLKELAVPFADRELKVITIGASTGGPKAVLEIVSGLPRDIPAAVLVVQHMGAGFTASFAERLDTFSTWDVVEARDGEVLQQGKIIVAPGDHHMTVDKKTINGQVTGVIRLNKGPKVNNVRPSVDVTMQSVAEVYGPAVLGVLLTGMGSDGANGMQTIKEKKGKTIAEDKSSCVVYGMPKAAIELGCVDKVVSLKDMNTKILETIS